jgi:hypothetical protein
MSQKMLVPQRAGYHTHVFNDVPGRLERALEAGYQFIKNAAGDKLKFVVGTAMSGDALEGYAMEIPEEWWKADMDAQLDEVNEREKGYKRGTDAHGAPGQDGRYIPTQGIKISTK